MERRRKLAAGKVKRAKIILLSNQGYLAREIAEKLDCHERTASRWINRFNKLGMVGLEEGPREGRPRVYSPEYIGLIIQTALTSPDELGLPFGSWTLDRLVGYLSEYKGVGMKRTRVAEVLGREGLRWRKQEGWFGERLDPEFAQKGGHRAALHILSCQLRRSLHRRDGAYERPLPPWKATRSHSLRREQPVGPGQARTRLRSQAQRGLRLRRFHPRYRQKLSPQPTTPAQFTPSWIS